MSSVEAFTNLLHGYPQCTDTDDMQPQGPQFCGAGNGAANEVREHHGVVGVEMCAEAPGKRPANDE